MASGTPERAIIVGASIGGLSAAVALKRIGVPVTVFEESAGPAFHPSAIKIFTNGVIALEQIGLGEAIRERSEPVEHDEFLSRRGERLVRIAVGDIARRHGVPPPVAALRRYEEERRPATAKVQTMAWRIGKVLSLRNPVATAIRDQGFKRFAGRGMAKDMDREFAELALAASAWTALARPLETTGRPAE